MGLPDGVPIDVHQHLWPPALIEGLRARQHPPMLRGTALHLPGEPAYEFSAAEHDPQARAEQNRRDGEWLALVSLSSPLGLEDLPAEEAEPLLTAWHAGAAALPDGFRAWAAVRRQEPDLAQLARRLTGGPAGAVTADGAGGFVGLQVPATWLATPEALAELAPVLERCERLGAPVLVHPGPVAAATSAKRAGPSAASRASAPPLPGWWPALVDYPAQLQAAWWSWQVCGRALLPTLRIGFVAGAGLAPLQHERFRARGGRLGAVDPDAFVETSSYGPQAIDALIRALGIDAIVRGSDRPHAEPAVLGFGAAADRAIDVVNPRRFLFGGSP